MGIPQDWAPYSSVEEAAKVYLRDPDLALTTEYEVIGDDTRRLAEVRLRMYTQLVTRSRQKSATETDIYCESFRYFKSVDDGGLAQMQRLLQFGRVLSRCIQ